MIIYMHIYKYMIILMLICTRRDDAAAAIDNMNEAELYGRVLRVNLAQPMKIKGGAAGWASQPSNDTNHSHHALRSHARIIFTMHYEVTISLLMVVTDLYCRNTKQTPRHRVV
jgi:hypothetical protein